ncbi:carboxylesterase/lipase family protein [Neptunicella marina]|uniref:Carboxylic ester hydrolase n=1 Tax=Neptunicella marina TaxID=2125989 RepID=A0A8J6ITD9_9ALTE|nr:carboxylesterase family protein [Neptunicella marina]MBC3767095.1 carboxylesterase family protein [Neptunicella marina]
MSRRSKFTTASHALVLSTLLIGGCNQTSSPDVSPGTGSKHDVVEIANGKLQGITQQNITVFKGIPYAQPPVKGNRWREPQPAADWQGIRNATQFGHDCMQKPFPSDAAPLGQTPAEDCLYLNVWTPNDIQNAAVVLWIHGGGYVNGGASPAVYDGSEFARQGVVFVSFNYRLGRFGFFAHPALTASQQGPIANYAFMDQIAALKWVKNNITAFGGNPEKITIMGESAGGGSVHTLMQAPASKDLFQSAVIMSGGGRSLMGERSISEGTEQNPSAEQIGINFAAKYAIEGNDEKALRQLRALSAEQVVDGLNLTALFTPTQGKPTYVGGPLLDGEIIRGSTQQMVTAGKVAHVPVMVGTTSQDIGYQYAASKAGLFDTFSEHAQQAQQAYDPDNNLPLQLLSSQVGQDRSMQEPARFFATQMTRLGEPAYLYRFSYVANEIRDGQGAQHATDIPFFFNTIERKYSALTAQDKQAALLPFRYLVNFIKTANPNGGGLPEWQAFQPDRANIMNFSAQGNAVHGEDPWKARLDAVAASAQ